MSFQQSEFASTPAAARAAVHLDASQRAVLDVSPGQSAVVIGAPGSGKTTTAIELIADRVQRAAFGADEVLLLAPDRASATRLRDRLALRLGVPTHGPLARTASSLAFQIVQMDAAERDLPTPVLLTGGEQDQLIGDMLAGHISDGGGPDWPDELSAEVRVLQGFRSELRELIARTQEQRLSPAQLAALGQAAAKPEWVAASDFLSEYLDVVEQSYPGARTAVELLRDAATILDASAHGSAVAKVAARRLVAVDDVHELTHGVFELLSVMAARGVAVVGFGDPDVATTTFRGANPQAVATFGQRLRVGPIPTLTLSTVYRQGRQLRAVTVGVTGHIGAALAGSQRQAASAEETGTDVGGTGRVEGTEIGGAGRVEGTEIGGAGRVEPVEVGEGGRVEGAEVVESQELGRTEPAVRVIVEASRTEQYAQIAYLLRQQHLVLGRPWSQMVVVVRSGAQINGVVRSLATAEVPTRTTVAGHALRDDWAAGYLIQAARVAVGHLDMDGEVANELLLSPLGGLDAVTLRRLRLALRYEELAGLIPQEDKNEWGRPADELLAEAMAQPGAFASIDSPIARRAERLAASLGQAREANARGASIEELLWGLWERSGLADTWGEQSRRGGVVGEDANAKLDGTVALFTSAKRFVEREPGKPAGDYLAELVGAAVPEDTLAPRSSAPAVLVTTPSGVAGLEFEVVVVAALHEGVWPNMRQRGMLLDPQGLPVWAAGLESATPVDSRKVVLDDELRMFALTVSRTSKLLVLAASEGEDEHPSVLLNFAGNQAERWHGADYPLTLRGLVGHMRRLAVVGSVEERETATLALARLAHAEVPGADPGRWYGTLPISSTSPLVDREANPEVLTTVRPSQIEKVESSPLEWFLAVMSGGGSGAAAGVGTILHAIMEAATNDGDISLERMARDIDTRWGQLGFVPGWPERHERARVAKMASGLAAYLRDSVAEGSVVLSTEGHFELVLEHIRLSGTVDRIERRADGSAFILDLKTGKNPPTKAEAATHAQLAAYQFAYREGALDQLLWQRPFGDETSESSPERERVTPNLGGATLLYVAEEAALARGYRPVEQAPMGDDEAALFWQRVEDAARIMEGTEFNGVRSEQARGFSAAYSYRIHLVPEVSA